jgi:hypothetical protein
MPAEALAAHPVHEAGWPMPSAEVRRQLEPVPHWGPVPADDGDPESD